MHASMEEDDEVKQNIGHLTFNEILEKDFKTCFPHNKISVRVFYENNDPIEVVIIETNEANEAKEDVEEHYIKTFLREGAFGKRYSINVTCKIKNNEGVTGYKIQTFAKEERWRYLPTKHHSI